MVQIINENQVKKQKKSLKTIQPPSDMINNILLVTCERVWYRIFILETPHKN